MKTEKNEWKEEYEEEEYEEYEEPKVYYACIKGFGQEIWAKLIVYDSIWKDVDVYYQHPMTGQWQENIDSIFTGWSEQSPKENEKWHKLVEAHLNDSEFITRVGDQVEKEGDTATIKYNKDWLR
jgi:hypothetical protein